MNNKHGKQFEKTLANSWVKTGWNLLRMNITDTGEEKPCDERVDFNNYRLFNELKSTKSKKFNVSQIKKHQMKYLVEIPKKFDNAIGLVFIEFYNKDKLIVVHILNLIKHCKNVLSTSFTLEELSKIGKVISKKGNYYNFDKSFFKFLDKCLKEKKKVFKGDDD